MVEFGLGVSSRQGSLFRSVLPGTGGTYWSDRIPIRGLPAIGRYRPGAGSKRLGLQTTAAIIFGRLVLVPPVGLGIVTVADKLGLFPTGDKMFKFVLLLQHTMPTSVLSGINFLHLLVPDGGTIVYRPAFM
ncbi:hypothetical protein BHM03_00021716 [Ensete ventricosum]|nr:hypothetical protein BHM03_00021716 [Ensete ventricosum]